MKPGYTIPYNQLQERKPQPGDLVLGAKELRIDATASCTDAVLGTPHRKQQPAASSLDVLLHPPKKEAIALAIASVHKKIAENTVKFKDFMQLKSGWDEYSSLRGEALANQIPPAIKDFLLSQLLIEEQNEQFVDKIYRWWLRGLQIEAAIRKVRVDAQVNLNARKSAARKGL
jgi:hypothetical protein